MGGVDDVRDRAHQQPVAVRTARREKSLEQVRAAPGKPAPTPFPTTEVAPAVVPVADAASAAGGEAQWRATAAARKRVVDGKAKVAELDATTKKLENDFYAWDDGQYRDRVIKPSWDSPASSSSRRRPIWSPPRRTSPISRRRRAGPAHFRAGSANERDVGGTPRLSLPVVGATETYRVETWGCQMNVLDGQRMAGQLEALGLTRARRGRAGRVVLLNTCSVREKAEAKVFSELGVLARRKQEDPDLVIGVTGCVAQVSGEEILERAPLVDFVAGTGQVEQIGELVAAARRDRRQALAVELPTDDPVYQFREISRESPFQAYVTVIEGCDQFCTFCIVPFTRGRERSRRASEIARRGRGTLSVRLHGGHPPRPDRQRVPRLRGGLRPRRAAPPRRPDRRASAGSAS